MEIYRLLRKARALITQDKPLPLDLMVALEEAGIEIDSI